VKNNGRNSISAAYHCHGCGAFIGVLESDGTLTIGGLRLVNCDALCPLCGKVVHWRRADVSLDNLRENLMCLRREFSLTRKELHAKRAIDVASNDVPRARI